MEKRIKGAEKAKERKKKMANEKKADKVTEHFFFLDAKTISEPGIPNMGLPLPKQKHCPLGNQSLLVALLQLFLFQQQALLWSENNRENLKIKNERAIESPTKS